MSFCAVILDLDGLLIDTESVALKAWQKAAQEFGFEVSLAVYARLIGRTMAASRAEIMKIIPFQTDIDQFIVRADEYYFDCITREGIKLMTGVPELLAWLEENDLPYTIATSSERSQAEWKIQKAGLTNRVGEFVTSDEVQHGKPAPDIFLRASQLVGQPSDKCVVVEDSEAGIMAASKAGAMPIMVPSTLPPSPKVRKLAYGVIETLFDVFELFESLRKRQA